MVERGRQRGLVPEVSRQRDHDDPRITRRGCFQDLQGAVRAAVIDQHDFVRPPGDAFQYCAGAAQKFRQNTLLVIERDSHGQSERQAHLFPLPLK